VAWQVEGERSWQIGFASAIAPAFIAMDGMYAGLAGA
jgi:hypothetical protein